MIRSHRAAALAALAAFVFVTSSSAALAQFPPQVDLKTLASPAGIKLFPPESSNCGTAIAAGGDVNGDGLGDACIGAPNGSNGAQTQAGSAHVVFGSASFSSASTFDMSGLNGANGFVIHGRATNDQLGTAVAIIGDVNGDGIPDLLVGAPLAEAGGPLGNEGEAYVVFGRTGVVPPTFDVGGLTAATGVRIRGFESGSSTGATVAPIGDVNGDGIADFAVAASTASEPMPMLTLPHEIGGIVIADFNGDGISDVVVTHDGFDDYTVLLGLGGGALTPGITYPAFADSPTRMLARDVDLDGDLDLLMVTGGFDPTTNAHYSRVNRLLNYGNAIFDFPHVMYQGFEQLTGVDAADVDGDGDVDLAVTDRPVSGGGEAVVVYNSATGPALANVHLGIAASARPNSVAIGDLKHDGFADVIVNDEPTKTLTVFNNDGVQFTAGQTITTTALTSSLATADLDLDGDVDVCGSMSSKLRVFRNISGNGTLANGLQTNAVANSTFFTLADVDADGKLDVLDTGGGTTLSVSLDKGDATFKLPNLYTLPANSALIAAGDLDGDGKVDAVTSGQFSAPTLTVCRNGGNGTFGGLQAGDTFVIFGGTPSLLSGDLSLATLDGQNGFRVHSVEGLAHAGQSVVGLGDVNGDGFADFAIGAPFTHVSGPDSGSAFVLFGGPNVGAGGLVTLSSGTTWSGFVANGDETTGGLGGYADAGDVDGDGTQDLILAQGGYDVGASTNEGAILVVRGSQIVAGGVLSANNMHGTNGFRAIGAVAGENIGHDTAACDLNNDGFTDVATATAIGAGKIYCLYGSAQLGATGTASFAPQDPTKNLTILGENSGDQAGWSLAAGDVNADGRNDLLIGARFGDAPGHTNWGVAYALFGLGGSLSANTGQVSLSAGGAQVMSLDAGAAHAGEPYVMLGSVTGTEPGIAFGAVKLPLDLDPYFLLTAAYANTPTFANFVGVLDAQGHASASLNVPPATTGVPPGTILFHAYLVLNAYGKPVFASNALPVTLTP